MIELKLSDDEILLVVEVYKRCPQCQGKKWEPSIKTSEDRPGFTRLIAKDGCTKCHGDGFIAANEDADA